MKLETIDRIDQRGNIRAHLTLDRATTACGIAIDMSQRASNNAMCRRCQAMHDVLASVRAGAHHVHGPALVAARALERLGVVTIEDNGFMSDPFGGRRSDRERWNVTINPEG